MLELLEDNLEDPAVILIAAPSLGRILHNAPGLTLQALDKQDAISKFANIIKKQKQADSPKVWPVTCMKHRAEVQICKACVFSSHPF